MALRSGYKGFKKLLPGLKLVRPGTLGIDNDVLIPELNKKFFPRSEQAVLGAKNIAYYEGATLVGDTTNGFNLTAGGSSIIAKLEHNKNFVAQRKIGQGDRFRIVLFMNKPSYTVPETTASQIIVDTTTIEYEFNSGNFNYAVFSYVGTTGTPVPQDTAEAMISLSGGSYAPYAMTNRELTPAILKATTDFTFDTDGNLLTKQGDIVVPYLRVTGVTATANDMDTPVCVVPEECRSQMTKIFPIISSGQVIMATLYTNGKIVVNTSVTSVTITIMIPWSILP